MREERPYGREPGSSSTWWIFALIVTLLGGAAALYYFWPRSEPPAKPAPAVAQPAPQAPAEPAIRHPIEGPAPEASKGLPTLENSDSMMREALSSLIGVKPFTDLVYPSGLVRRIVATVDNLPRETAPARMLPWQPVPGTFLAIGGEGSGDETVIAARNAARYDPYVRVVLALDTRALVRRYIDSYPLFQQAYEQLGYPGKYFNDRLIEAIDDLLAAPELPAPPKLVQPKVRYTFADPELEALSAGQKLMIRVGHENELKLKAKLREIRAEILAAQPR